MLNIFNTQLQGIFQHITSQETAIEDSARIMAQSILGDGAIYMYTDDEALLTEAQQTYDALPDMQPLTAQNANHLTSLDTALFFIEDEHEEETDHLLERTKASGASLLLILPSETSATYRTAQADVTIETSLTTPLIPMDHRRIGYPRTLVQLYVYEALYVTLQDILSEYDDC